MKKVAVIMGSDSDFPVMKNAVKSLKDMGIPVEAHVLSAHRTPAEAGAFASSARQNGFGVIIAAAGKAAHLAGVLAGHTTLPVIGVPMKASVLDGMDALLATVQMPKGVPVATVAIDGADNAALLAAQKIYAHICRQPVHPGGKAALPQEDPGQRFRHLSLEPRACHQTYIIEETRHGDDRQHSGFRPEIGADPVRRKLPLIHGAPPPPAPSGP